MKDLHKEKTLKRLITENFVAGAAWGFGTVLGATILFAIFGFMLSRAKTLPFLGQIVSGIMIEVDKYRVK